MDGGKLVLTENEYSRSIKELVDLQNTTWNLKNKNNQQYLSIRLDLDSDQLPHCLHKHNKDINESINQKEIENDAFVEPFDPGLIPKNKNKNKYINQYYFIANVVYSKLWKVPILYFDLIDSNGCSIVGWNPVLGPKTGDGVDDCGLSPTYIKISQIENPIDQVPCWYVHPCDIPEIMKISLQYVDKEKATLKYVLSWLRYLLNQLICLVQLTLHISNIW